MSKDSIATVNAADIKTSELYSKRYTTSTHEVETKTLPLELKNKIVRSLSHITENEIMHFLSMSFESRELRQDLAAVVNRKTTYIARIPKKLEDRMARGLIDFMTDSKTGENLGTLVDERHRIAGSVRIDRAPVKVDMAANISRIAIQQQLAQVAAAIDDVRSRVISLQEGHDADLFGSIKGMHQQMLQMRNASNPETRRQLATHAITVLNDTRGRIETAIELALRDLPEVSGTDAGVLWQIAKDKGFLSKTDELYNRIEELASYYLAATQLLGYAFAFLDEPDPIEDVFTISESFLGGTNLSKLASAERLYNEPIGETWYKNPEKYFLGLKQSIHEIEEGQDYIEIELTGEELLEVANNEYR